MYLVSNLSKLRYPNYKIRIELTLINTWADISHFADKTTTLI